jgi:hypothetical protein
MLLIKLLYSLVALGIIISAGLCFAFHEPFAGICLTILAIAYLRK